MSLVFRAQYCTMPLLAVKRKFHYRTKKKRKTAFDSETGLDQEVPKEAFPSV